MNTNLEEYKNNTKYGGKNFSAHDLASVKPVKLCDMIKKIEYRKTSYEVKFSVHHVNPVSW